VHQSLSVSSVGAAAGSPSGIQRPRLTPVRASSRWSALVAVVRTEPRLPSLAAARMTATLRARGDDVRVVETDEAGLLAIPRVGLGVDLVAMIDADDEIRTFPSSPAAEAAAAASDLVPDFSDYSHARTRFLPIAAGVGGTLRPLGAVLHEVREYARRYAMPDLVFVDRELNADPALFAGLIDSIQRHAPGVQWMAAVGVDDGDTNGGTDGLSRKTMRAAAAAGLRSIVLRAEGEASGGRSVARARALAMHAGDAGILARIAVAAPTITIDRANVIAAMRVLGASTIADIAMKD
jgi:hypothetical protein